MEQWLIRSDAKRGIWIPWAVELSLEAEADILLAYKIAERKSDAEISGIGCVQTRELNSLFVSNIIIPRQTCSGGATTFLGKEMSAILEELEEKGENAFEYYFWWHSHVEGRARFSSIDDEMIKNRLYAMMSTVHLSLFPDIPNETMSGPFLSVVGNIYGDMTARCDFLHRMGNDYRQYTFGIPLVRHLVSLSKEDQRKVFEERSARIEDAVEERVTFRSSFRDPFRERRLWRLLSSDDEEEDDDRRRS